jgi:hypothetical protein
MPRPDKDVQIQSMLSEIPLRTSDKPKPDSAEWWQEVAQGLGVKIHEMRQQLETTARDWVQSEKALESERKRLWDAIIEVDAIEHKHSIENGGELNERIERIGGELTQAYISQEAALSKLAAAEQARDEGR